MTDCYTPTQYLTRFGDAISLLCGGNRPSDLIMKNWLTGDDLYDELQQFTCTYGPYWSQGIEVIDAAKLLADSPTEGVSHETLDKGNDIMDFLILVGQRKGLYPGEYLPEALDVIDGNGNDENPDFLIDSKVKYEASKEFSAVSIIRVRVPDTAITEALYPASKAIEGNVI